MCIFLGWRKGKCDDTYNIRLKQVHTSKTFFRIWCEVLQTFFILRELSNKETSSNKPSQD